MRWIVALGLLVACVSAQRNRIPCYDHYRNPQRCMPPFVNAAFNLKVDATNTCGERGPTEFCVQTAISGALKWCDFCDARDPNRAHPSSYLTDFNNNDNLTWWQSETMLQGIQYPNSVNLTMHLGKAFDITYVKLKFKSSRPESFAIYKKTSEDSAWIPYQYYSASCEETYSRRVREIITVHDETKALCSDEFSDISPLSGGSVAFSTLEGRPSAYDFEHSAVLQEWVTATHIKIVLNRMNTFGDEVFRDPSVLKSYFYAISDFAVGGRCQCNGHASECVRSTGQGLEERLVCRCEHNTMGPNCEECLPFYNNRPWERATATDAYECQACDCNGKSDRCVFDQELYRKTGNGGRCMDCRESTAGANCERCKENYYRRSDTDRCMACNCDEVGSLDQQCDTTGRCRCKPGVTGEKCDRCMNNFFDFGTFGCRECQCSVDGSKGNNPECRPDSGVCTCKENVEGQDCDRCKPGYFNLQGNNEYGCIACFCYGHSSVCTTAPGFSRRVVHSQFDSGKQRWTGRDSDGGSVPIQYNGITQVIAVSAPSSDAVYFSAPDRYLGNQLFSYDQYLSFDLRTGEDGARASILDIVIEGGSGFQISAPIFSQNNPIPRTVSQEYRFRLSEKERYQWTPPLSANEFQRLLSNITSIRIRASYTPQGVGFLDNVKLESARQANGAGSSEVSHIEICTCPDGYVGQFCETCAPGYHRDPANGGPLARCVPCDCNGHSDACEINTGQCICQHNTVGDHCERCAPGYYGYALAGTPDDCQMCPCPDNGECVELLSGDVACINCQEGYTGNRCEYCSDGYFGDPEGRYGPRRPCQKCVCNDNIDPNAVGNCNTTTGECLKCIYNTGGWDCSECLVGFYGSALDLPRGQCKDCGCYGPGTYRRSDSDISCDVNTGECNCHFNVIGRMCDQCHDGYWNIDSGNGCEQCDCDPVGSFNRSCDITSGQCNCRPGVTGRRCDQCMDQYFGFSFQGCNECACDPEGAYDLQCDIRTGQCLCQTNVEGRQCDRCMENKYNITAGCIDCPACYNLVQDQVNILRQKLSELREIIENIGDNPQAINDTDFRQKLSAVNDSVNQLLEDAKNNVGEDGTLAEQFRALLAATNDILVQCGRITLDLADAHVASESGIDDITEAERLIDAAEEALRNAEAYINVQGQEALQQAKQAQDKFGQQSDRMTQIAKEARELADQQEADAMEIEKKANEALNTSEEALRITEEALQTPGDIADKIRDLNRDTSSADSLFNQTKKMAEDALSQAEDAYSDALGIYTEAESIKIPVVDIDKYKDTAAVIKDDAGMIKDEADRLMEQNRDLMDDVAQQKQMAEDMLDQGIRQQQVADGLLADADVARDIARKAVAKAEDTLEQANDTLKTLKDFERKVEEGKSQAEEAKKRIPGIEDQITEAEDKTREAESNLADAEANAIRARDIARLAQDTASMASDDASQIKDEAAQTKTRAMDLNDEADDLKADVDDAQARLEGYEIQAEQDANLTRTALKKADEAKTSATDSSRRVQDALEMVEDILDQLASLDQIDVEKLDELEQSLDSAQESLEASEIDRRYQELLQKHAQQQSTVTSYVTEFISLQEAVENIAVINATIPRTCFKDVTLEPTNPTVP